MYLPFIYNTCDNNDDANSDEDTTNKLLKMLPKTKFC